MSDDTQATDTQTPETQAPASGQSAPSGAQFEALQNEGAGGVNVNPDLDMIMDIPVTLSLEVGKTAISIRKLLGLNQGSVIELDRLAGEPLDVLVNGTLIAHAEVVVVNEKFALRLTDVINAEERIRKLS